MGIADKIAEIEAEMARTQKNKATEHHLGMLKAKLAKYKAELNAPKTASQKGAGFEVQKTGDARAVLIGFPSVGKSTLLSTITSTYSKQSEAEFTTLDCISGKLDLRGSSIQLLDLPGIIDGAAANRGRGRQVISIARTADLIIMMLDPRRPSDKEILCRELSSMGIRLNKHAPDVTLIKGGSGMDISIACKLTSCREETIRMILREYKIHNCQLTIREDITDEDLIDLLCGGAVYVPCIFCYNKIDEISYEDFLALANSQDNFVLSCNRKWNLEELKDEIWKRLDLIRVYTKKKGNFPDLDHPVVFQRSSSIKDLCRQIHKDFESNFKYAWVWGRSAKHSPQKVGLGHIFADEDVVQLFTK